MQAAISLTTSQGGHSSPDLPPVDKNEFNEEIYRYLTQLHQQQMQQRAQNSSSTRVPSDVQQALNLNTAFLSFSQKLVQGLIAEQTQCIVCQQMHKEWLLKPSSSELQAQALDATKFLDGIVDAHARHAEAGQDEYYMAKLPVAAILGQLQASKRFQSRMEDIAKELWGPKEPFNSDRFAARDEMLLLEWKVMKYSHKTLYHHYLYFLKCVEAAEDSINELNSKVVIAQVIWEKERFDQTTLLLSSHFGQEVTKGKQPLENVPRGFPTISKAVERSSQDVNPPHSEFRATSSRSDRDQGWENIKVSSFQTPKGLVFGDGTLDDANKMAEEACSRLLESLRNITFEEDQPPASSISGLSEIESLPSHDSNSLADDAKEQCLSQQREAFAGLTQSWVSRTTGRAIIDSKACADAEEISQDGGEVATESSKHNSNDKGKGRVVYGGHQSSTRPRRKIDRGSDGQDNEDENEEDDRDRKRQKHALTTDLRGFACPYFKHDPERHARLKACSSTNFPNMHRLKEHLYRTHRMPIHCPRCRHVFPKKENLLQHQVKPIACDVQPGPTFVGFNELQEERLRSRKQTTKNDADKWKDIYRILFPEDDELSMPSPYHEVHITSIDQYNSLIKQRVRDELAYYDDYQRQILPVLIHSKLSTSGDAENPTSAELTNIINECLSETLNDYQLSSGQDGQRDMSDGSSVRDVGGAFANIQGMENDFYLDDSIWEQTDLGINLGYDDSIHGPVPEQYGLST